MTRNISFGDKDITLSGWTGRDRRLMQNKREEGLLDFKYVELLLVHEKLEQRKYLTTEEMNYALFSMYKEEYGDEIAVDFQCDECMNNLVTILSCENILSHSRKSDIVGKSLTLDEYIINFDSPAYTDQDLVIFNSLTSDVDKNFYNMLLHITNITKGEEVIVGAAAIEDVLESLSMSQFDKLLGFYDEHTFLFTPVEEIDCTSCGSQQKVFCDYLPSLVS